MKTVTPESEKKQTFCGCFICKRLTPADRGGLCSTGDIDDPVYQWICNACLTNKVIPVRRTAA